MRVGLIISVLLHTALLAWALVTIHRLPDDRASVIEPLAVALVTPDELTRLKKGDRNAKQLAAVPKDSPKPDMPKKEAPKPKPVAAAEPPTPPPPPPPPPEVKPPEPVKAEPPPEPEAPKVAALAPPPPPPEPAPGPTPEEKKQMEEKLEQERKQAEEEAQKRAEEQRKAEAEEARKKAEEEARKKAAEELRKKQLAEKKKKEDDAKKKAIEDAKKKQKFDADNMTALLNKIPDKSGAPAVEKSDTPATAKGPVAGAPEGKDNRLTASETALLAQAIRQGVQPCWRVLGGGQGADATAVKMRIQFNQDGTLKGEPQIMGGQNTTFFMAAAESARRAVIQCQPYNLPAAKYSAWQDVILNFDPKDMF